MSGTRNNTRDALLGRGEAGDNICKWTTRRTVQVVISSFMMFATALTEVLAYLQNLRASYNNTVNRLIANVTEGCMTVCAQVFTNHCEEHESTSLPTMPTMLVFLLAAYLVSFFTQHFLLPGVQRDYYESSRYYPSYADLVHFINSVLITMIFASWAYFSPVDELGTLPACDDVCGNSGEACMRGALSNLDRLAQNLPDDVRIALLQGLSLAVVALSGIWMSRREAPSDKSFCTHVKEGATALLLFRENKQWTLIESTNPESENATTPYEGGGVA